jgi:CO/xanthine dehydrogenase Mo-binding subunit
MNAGIGSTVRRKEDLRLVTGHGCYSDDFNFPEPGLWRGGALALMRTR